MIKIWLWWKAGFVALVPIVILFLFGRFIVGWFIATGSLFIVTDSTLLNVFLFALFLVAIPLIVRTCLHFSFVRSIGVALTGWIPIVGPLFRFFFRPEENEKSFPEIEFYLGDSVKMFGVVVNEIREPDYNEKGDPIVPWLLVHLPTFAGPIIKIKKSAAIFTGRTGKDTAMTAMSFGFIYDVVKKVNKEKTPRA